MTENKPNIKEGDRIRLIFTDDPSFTGINNSDGSKIPPWRKRGDTGTVSSISLAINTWQVWINWDDGAHFALLYGIDKFEVI